MTPTINEMKIDPKLDINANVQTADYEQFKLTSDIGEYGEYPPLPYCCLE